jgi:hypothetical protein
MIKDDTIARMRANLQRIARVYPGVRREHALAARAYATALIQDWRHGGAVRGPRHIEVMARPHVICPVGRCEHCKLVAPLKASGTKKVCAWGCLPELEHDLEIHRIRSSSPPPDRGLDR